MKIPTIHQYDKYQKLYDYYNESLFKNELPNCILVLSRNSSLKCGYFYSNRWRDEKGNKTHEISLNPNYLAAATDIDVCQTLVHEMCHLWQQVFGKPSRAGYHNTEWGDKMKMVGLMPSNTGEPGGRQTGQQMADYPINNGNFQQAFDKMPADLLFPFKSSNEYLELITHLIATAEGDTIMLDGATIPIAEIPLIPSPPKRRNKVKYTCYKCGANAWGKPELEITCGNCLKEYLKMYSKWLREISLAFRMSAVN